MQEYAKERIGLVAGWGSFPVEVAQQLRACEKDVYVVALKGHAERRLELLATKTKWLGVLKLGHHMKFFKEHNITKVVLAGKLFKDKILYHGRGWIDHAPDFTCMRILGGSFVTKTRDGRDDTVLNAVVDAFQKRGIEVLAVTDVAPTLLAREAHLTRSVPSKSQLLDIEFGWSIAQQMGGLDVGQSITVKDQVVLGVEAIEGTDALIARTGAVCPRGGFTLIKVAKPNQDMRFDVPTIGLRTMEQAVRAGCACIAIEANRTIVVDRDATLDFANQHRLSIISLGCQASQATSSTSEILPIALDNWLRAA